jgi:antitoxin (DNA-binding transcriptional repressor) of toxin-antitoxin stability system
MRELRQNASRYLEEVAQGSRSRSPTAASPIARRVPIMGDPWQDRINAGEAVKAARRVSVHNIKPVASPRSASETLRACRLTSNRGDLRSLVLRHLYRIVIAHTIDQRGQVNDGHKHGRDVYPCFHFHFIAIVVVRRLVVCCERAMYLSGEPVVRPRRTAGGAAAPARCGFGRPTRAEVEFRRG